MDARPRMLDVALFLGIAGGMLAAVAGWARGKPDGAGIAALATGMCLVALMARNGADGGADGAGGGGWDLGDCDGGDDGGD